MPDISGNNNGKRTDKAWGSSESRKHIKITEVDGVKS